MNVLDYTIHNLLRVNWVDISETQTTESFLSSIPTPPKKRFFDPLFRVKQWLDALEIRDRQMAHWLCKLIPPQCPFERDLKFFGKVLWVSRTWYAKT